MGEILICETRQKSYDTDAFLAFLERFCKVAVKPSILVLDNLNIH